MLAGCGPKTPTAPDTMVDSVGRAGYEVRAFGTDLITVHVTFPLDDGRHPAVVFIPGGFVAAERYQWQADAWAKAGFIVAVPEQLFELGFFSVEYGEQARLLLEQPPAGSVLDGRVDGVIAWAGHSLGGVVAAKLAARGTVPGLLLEASYPDTADVEALSKQSLLSLSLAGTKDCSAAPEKVREGWTTLPSPTALVMLEGVTHYQFTDSQAEDESRGCTPDVPLETAHTHIIAASTRLLNNLVSGLGLIGPWDDLPGATAEVR